MKLSRLLSKILLPAFLQRLLGIPRSSLYGEARWMGFFGKRGLLGGGHDGLVLARMLLLISILWWAAIALLIGLGTPFWKAVGIVTPAVALLTVLTGIGLAVMRVVTSVLLEYRSSVVQSGLRNFGKIELYPGRLEWRADEAALRSYIFGGGIAGWALLAGMTAAVGMLLLLEAVDWSAWLPGSGALVAAKLPLAGITIAAAALVCWRGRPSLRIRQEATCQATLKKCAARWEELQKAAAPQFKELQSLMDDITTAGETAGWELTTKAFKREEGDRIWVSLSPKEGGIFLFDKRLRLNTYALLPRDPALSPEQRVTDDAALIRLTLDAAQRGLQKRKADFLGAAACYWEAVAAGCEAEVILWRMGVNGLEDGLKRFSILMERLFSRSVLTMLEEVVNGKDPEEFKRTVTAIRQETEELIAEAEARRLNKTEACSLLGVRPEAEGKEIDRACQSLLELWRPADGSDKAAIERTKEIQRAYALLKEQGRAWQLVARLLFPTALRNNDG